MNNCDRAVLGKLVVLSAWKGGSRRVEVQMSDYPRDWQQQRSHRKVCRVETSSGINPHVHKESSRLLVACRQESSCKHVEVQTR